MTLHGSFNTATNALWETIKIEPFDDADSSEFGMDPSKMGLEQLLAIGITDSAVNSGETGCIPDGGGSGGTGGTVPGRESPNTILGLKGNMYKHTSQQLFCDSPKQPDQKPQIRHDCMWAGMCADQSHPEKHSAGRVGCNCLQQRAEQTLDLMLMPGKSYYKAVKIEGQPNGGAVDTARSAGALRPQSYPVSPPVKSVLFKPVQSSAELPAGSSLLKRQNQLSVLPIQGYKQLPPSPPSSSECTTSSAVEAGWEGRGLDPRTVVRVPHIPRGSFLSVSEQELRSITAQNHARPDTPLSLEEDPLEFKHNLNLLTATCTMGSNQQRLLPNAYSSLSSAVATGTAEVSPSSVNGNTINNTTPTSATNSSCSSATMTGTESRTSGGFGGRLGGNCSCGNSIGGVSCHTPQCYYNYLQDDTPTSVEDLRNRLMLIDDLNTLPELSTHHHLHHHHHHQVRPDSPDSSLRQLLSDLREIECSSESRSYLLDDQPTSSPTAAGVLAKDGSLQFSLHPQQQQQHQHQQQQQQQQQGLRHQSSLAPCGGGMSGGAHIACNKECCWSSLELSHLASPGNERKRRNHQFAYRRRSITARGLISDDDEDEEDDLMKQFAEEDDDFDKHFEQIAPGNLHYAHAPLSEDEEEDEEEDEDESEEEEEEEDEEKETREEDEDEEEEEDEDEDEDVQNESMYGSRSRSRNRTSRHRYHNQYRRTPARASYRPYEVDAYSNGKVPKMPASNLLANGAVNTIIAGSGASSLKSSLLGSRTGANCTGGNNAGTAVASATAQQPTGTANNSYQATHFGDHSYTRPKGGYNMNELGVQTPSDSDEEIDVVSVGDKNLPTNPTERDYRHLQSEVASKIRTASSRGTTNGSLPYGSGAHHHHHHYQRQHQLTDGPRQGPNHLGGIYPTPASSTTISGANTPLPTRSGGASAASSPPPACTSSGSTSRKRSVGGSGGSSKRSSNSSKRMRLSHSKRGGGDGNAGGRFDSCAQSLADELDTVEKRNLHNNLERQRRIGLKNLFEELKRQIPQLRDKDRAPKVNILREAATLCTRLNQEAEQANELRQQQIKLYERVRYLRASMYSQRVGLE